MGTGSLRRQPAKRKPQQGTDKNNPDSNDKASKGPTPRGNWKVGDRYNSKHTGRDTIYLNPLPGNSVFGTSRDPTTFRMHGDSSKRPGDASEGCIVCGPKTRNTIYKNDGGGATVTVVK
ncbi:hypothetical protein [Methyloglobulus sp.]|uniref:hypothetical protein n=1 Tax=Methyloglobulus sp. TaxID=2518622 RepID=UPI003989C089